MTDQDKRILIANLKKEIAKLEWEEKLLRKRDDRLRWEQNMITIEEGLKARGNNIYDRASPDAMAGVARPQPQENAYVIKKGEKPGGDPQAHPADNTEVNLESGTTYVLFEKNPQRAVDLYLREIHQGKKGLYITRSNPRHIKRKYDLSDSKLCWLTSVKASEDVISVSGLQELSILVSNQIDELPESIILLDGLEYLISNNDFSIVLRLVQQIRDKVSTSDSVMLMPLNSDALDGRELTLLERECEKV